MTTLLLKVIYVQYAFSVIAYITQIMAILFTAITIKFIKSMVINFFDHSSSIGMRVFAYEIFFRAS